MQVSDHLVRKGHQWLVIALEVLIIGLFTVNIIYSIKANKAIIKNNKA